MPPITDLTIYGLPFAALLGALIGSFSNVVVYRLPRSESIAFPGSHCPNCNRSLTAMELVPVLSWIVQGGRCRGCRTSISARYPVVEAIVAIGYALIWLRWPPQVAGWTFLPLAAVFTLLVILAAIDIDTFTLPDVLTFPALLLALLGAAVYPPEAALPSLWQALSGAALGAGLLALVNRVGGLVLRRFSDTRERLWPIGFDQVNIGAVAGALAGWRVGLTVVALSLVANLIGRRTLRLPEPIVLALWPLALLLSLTGLTIAPLTAVSSSIAVAGAAAVAGALYWWSFELLSPQAHTGSETGAHTGSETGAQAGTEAGAQAGSEAGAQSSSEADVHAGDQVEEDEEPVAMGFGDVKLAAVMGALLGPEKLLLALFLSFLVGAVGGLTVRALGGDRAVPFGPYLVLATLIALFLGDAILGWYLGLLSV